MRRAIAAFVLLAAGCAAEFPNPMPQSIVVLGTAQDAGRPHIGCAKACCVTAAAQGQHERVASLALRSRRDAWWLVDATPDLPAQVRAMGSLPSGILLTHAHIGHYTGLMYLGREGLNARGMPVHCSEAMAEFLRENAPWDQLVRLGNVELRPFRSGERIVLDGERLSVEAIRVPHRDEYADTHAFGIRVEYLQPLLYLPDLDRWEDWERDLGDVAAAYPLWLVDGSFFSGDELGGRDMSVIPHPPVVTTMDLLEERVRAGRLEVWFTHLNHTNPLWDPESAAAHETARRGFGVARTGQLFRSSD
ncbi:MAG: MBL fold metallo-hydrolase [Planctomycetota bacterium]|nr:MBL fold metallo-hydrolase [Planctomycetota bacterium]